MILFASLFIICKLLCPQNRRFGGQTVALSGFRPRNRHFGGRTVVLSGFRPRNRRFGGQTWETDVRSRHSAGGAAPKLSCAAWRNAGSYRVKQGTTTQMTKNQYITNPLLLNPFFREAVKQDSFYKQLIIKHFTQHTCLT